MDNESAKSGHAFDRPGEVSVGSLETMREQTTLLGRLDQYELIRELGGGGFGVVYLARDTVAGIEVAVKGLPPMVRNDTEELERIRENFALVSRLHHPNIAAALHLHLAKEVWYADAKVKQALRVLSGDMLMVMAYAPGVTLNKWRKQFPDGKVPVALAVDVCRQIASALDYAHGEKVVHRDIKPSNVMVETREQGGFRREDLGAEKKETSKNSSFLTPNSSLSVRVLDFGLAAEIRSSMSRVSQEKGDTSGTRPYMAPEQWGGRRQDGQADQYALAVLFYELVSGTVPFASAFDTGDPIIMMLAVENKTADELTELTKKQNAVLARALSKKAEQRFGSCLGFIDALTGGGGVRTGGDRGPVVGGKGKSGVFKILLPLAALGVACAGYLAVNVRGRAVVSPTPVAVPSLPASESASLASVTNPPGSNVPNQQTLSHALAEVSTNQAVLAALRLDEEARLKAAEEIAAAEVAEQKRLEAERQQALAEAKQKQAADDAKRAAERQLAGQGRDVFTKAYRQITEQPLDRGQAIGALLDNVEQAKSEAERLEKEEKWSACATAYQQASSLCEHVHTLAAAREQAFSERKNMIQSRASVKTPGYDQVAPTQWQEAQKKEVEADGLLEKGDFAGSASAYKRAEALYVKAGEVAQAVRTAMAQASPPKAPSPAVPLVTVQSDTAPAKTNTWANGSWLTAGADVYTASRREGFPLLVLVYATGVDRAVTDPVIAVMGDEKVTRFAQGWLSLVKEDLAQIPRLGEEEKIFARRLVQNNKIEKFPVLLVLNGGYQADYVYQASELRGDADAVVAILRKIKERALR